MQSSETNDGRFLKGVNDPVDNSIKPVHNSQSRGSVITLTSNANRQFSMPHPPSEQLLVWMFAFSHCVFCVCYVTCLTIGTYAGINTWLLTLAILIAYGLWIKRCGQLVNYNCRPSEHERRIERFDVD